MTTFVVRRGETIAWECEAGFDLTGWSVTSTLRADVNEATATPVLATFTVTVDAGSAGTFTLSQTAAETAAWTDGGVADIKFVSPSGAVEFSDVFSVRLVGTATR